MSVCVHVCVWAPARPFLEGFSHFGPSTFKLRKAFVEKMMLNKTKSLSPSSGIALSHVNVSKRALNDSVVFTRILCEHPR